jgi:hypothetical protein
MTDETKVNREQDRIPTIPDIELVADVTPPVLYNSLKAVEGVQQMLMELTTVKQHYNNMVQEVENEKAKVWDRICELDAANETLQSKENVIFVLEKQVKDDMDSFDKIRILYEKKSAILVETLDSIVILCENMSEDQEDKSIPVAMCNAVKALADEVEERVAVIEEPPF